MEAAATVTGCCLLLPLLRVGREEESSLERRVNGSTVEFSELCMLVAESDVVVEDAGVIVGTAGAEEVDGCGERAGGVAERSEGGRDGEEGRQELVWVKSTSSPVGPGDKEAAFVAVAAVIFRALCVSDSEGIGKGRLSPTGTH